jgi:branched-chain amino acid transport system substrate-binding protein
VRRASLCAVLAGTAIVVSSACGLGGTFAESSKGDIVIAYDGPLSGAAGVPGSPVMTGARFAVETSGLVSGYRVSFLPFDDAVNGSPYPDKAIENLREMIANAKVLGMVGPFNSPIAVAMIPVANRAGLAMISPSTSFPCLTQPLPGCAPQPAELRRSGANNFFRISATDPDQGVVMAQYAVGSLKVRKVAVFSDSTGFGRIVADSFSKAFATVGGTVVLRRDFDLPPPDDFRPFLIAARDAGTEAIFAGAVSTNKACVVRAQMQGIFTPDIFFLGTDGISSTTDCVKDAGANANDNVQASIAVDDPAQSSDPDVKRVVAAYREKFPGDTNLSAWTFAGYDAAKILLQAIGRAIEANGGKFPSRQQVIDAVAKTTDYRGVTGVYTFDANGDVTHPVLSIYRISAGRWVYARRVIVN